MTSASTTSREFFEGIYRRDEDPWRFASKPQELKRYEAIVKALSGRRYRRAFEPGCSIGVLTLALGGLCERVEAIDLSPTAVERARERTGGVSGVEVRVGSLTDGLPPGEFDLVVLSEIGYYFTPQVWQELTAALIQPLQAGATVIACHWLGHSVDHLMHGDDVHEILRSRGELRLQQQQRHETYRLDIWERV